MFALREVLLASTFALLFAGCGSSESGSPSGAGGGSGTGGSAGAGGTAGSAGDSGTAGSAGDSGTAGSADDSGAAGGAGDSGVAGGDGGTDAATDAASTTSFDDPGPHPVGHAYFTATDTASSRTLPIEVWYPADESARPAATQGMPIADFEPPGANHDTLATLVAAAPAGCTRAVVHSAADATPAAGGPFPVVAFSHCHNCVRFSEAFVAERLASHGIAVVAPDHVGNTVYDAKAGNSAPINDKFLAVREGDIRFTLDVVLDATNADVPAALRGLFDPNLVAVFGHSYGGATAALVAQDDARVRAVLALAVPMESPAFPKGAAMANLHLPVAFLRAEEDNSISTLGNQLIEQNFNAANPPAWLSRVADTGHWSFSDIAALIPQFAAGCGDGKRMTNGQPFTYLDNDTARGIAAGFVTAFFARTLLSDGSADAYLAAGHPPSIVTASVRQ